VPWRTPALPIIMGLDRTCGRTRGEIEMADLKKGARITGTQRDKLATDLKKKYEKGASIRSLAESTGRSYGFVHRVLSESGVTLRGRGGATRTKKK
jgi:predicted transcriptional regulator